jgi:aminopeptidase S
MPPGITWSFSPASITSGGSSTLTIGVAAGTPVGVYMLQVIATGAAVVRSDQQLVLTVVAGTAAQDFSV